MQTIKKNHPSSTVQLKTTPKLFAWLASFTTVLLIIVVQLVRRGDYQILRIAGVVMLPTAAVFIFTPFYLLSKHDKTQVGKTYMQAGEVVQQGLLRSYDTRNILVTCCWLAALHCYHNTGLSFY